MQAIAGTAHGTLENVVGLQLIVDIGAIGPVTKLVKRTRNDHEQVGKLEQLRADIVRQALAEVGVLRIADQFLNGMTAILGPAGAGLSPRSNNKLKPIATSSSAATATNANLRGIPWRARMSWR